MLERKTLEVELFGKKLLLSERDAKDVLMLANYAEKACDNTIQNNLVQAAAVLEASLHINYANTKWYEFNKKKLKKLLSSQSLLKELSQRQIIDLAFDVLKMEGLVSDKKEINSEKKTQTV